MSSIARSRIGLFVGLLALASASLAQGFGEFDSTKKEEVLGAISDTLRNRAYAAGVDLDRWPALVEKHRAAIDAATGSRSFAMAVNRALGEFGISHLRVRLARGGSGSASWNGQPVAFVRQGRIQPHQAAIWLDDESALIRVRSFGPGYDRAYYEAAFREAHEAKYLVLDLRSNGGGLLNNLLHLLGLMLEPGTPIGTNLTRQTVDAFHQAVKADPVEPAVIAAWAPRKLRVSRGAQGPFPGKIAVLVNRGTGSASEMVAAALREIKASPLLGTRTAGAVLSSTFGRLPHGFEIQYPVADYVTVKGVRLEGNPIVPDVEIGYGEPSDAALRRALERLKGTSSEPRRAA